MMTLRAVKFAAALVLALGAAACSSNKDGADGAGRRGGDRPVQRSRGPHGRRGEDRFLGPGPASLRSMCRNIRQLHNFEPPATDEEVRAAALQYVRKISGSSKPSQANREVFDRAVDDAFTGGLKPCEFGGRDGTAAVGQAVLRALA